MYDTQNVPFIITEKKKPLQGMAFLNVDKLKETSTNKKMWSTSSTSEATYSIFTEEGSSTMKLAFS